MQLADSFFPSGSYTLSHGLEFLVQSGQITSAIALQEFASCLLQNKVSPTDGVALIHSYRASQSGQLAEVQRIDRQLFACTLVEITRTAQQKSGRALLMVARSTWPSVELEGLEEAILAGNLWGMHPVIFGVVGRVALLNEGDVVFAYLHSWLTGLLGAALRLGIVGHLKVQQILRELAPQVETAAQQAAQTEMENLWACTPLIDIAQMGHPGLAQHLFLT